DLDSSDLVKHRIGKPPKECSSHCGVDELIRLRIAADRRDAPVDGNKKASRAPRSLRLVPAVRFVKIKLRLWSEAKPLHFRRLSLARTSAQDFAADGLRACARRRLASSLRCASVTGIASGVSARLSQISSSNCSRSGTLSARISLRTVLIAAFCASRSGAASLTSGTDRQYDLREVRLTSGAQRGLASSRPEPHVLLGTNERGGQPWVSLARRSSSVSMFTRTPLPWPTRQRTAVRRWCRWG